MYKAECLFVCLDYHKIAPTRPETGYLGPKIEPRFQPSRVMNSILVLLDHEVLGSIPC